MQVRLMMKVLAEVPEGTDLERLKVCLSAMPQVGTVDGPEDQTIPLPGSKVVSFETESVEKF